MKKLLLSLLLGLSALATAPVHALTATGNFDVTVNLYPKCEITAPSALALHYVSFQTSASTNQQSFTVKCTNNLPYNFSIGGSAGASGTLVGLNYTLATYNSAGTTAASSGVGSGAAQTYQMQGSIAQGQSGDCATVQTGTSGTQVNSTTGANTGAALGTACSATSASGAHTLTITY